MKDLDMELEIAFDKAGIRRYEKVPTAEELRDRLRPLVKQAFLGAGWSEPVVIHTPGVEPVPSSYMTGQEWYDRFEKELDTNGPMPDIEKWSKLNAREQAVFVVEFVSGEMFKAAKKAAGIE